MRTAAVCLLAGTALLAGCSRPGGAQASAEGGSGPQASAPPRPHPKAGLWRTSVSTNAGPGVVMDGELCLDPHTEDTAFSADGRAAAKDCEPTSFEPQSGGFAFTAVCHARGRTITTTGVATGDFKTNYSLDVSTRIDPPPAVLPPELHAMLKATFIGPCRPGQKPGEASMKFGGFGQG